MISLIKGKIVSNFDGELLVITNGGVGYKLFVNPKSLFGGLGSEVEILTHLSVRENAMDLYGFANEVERKLFKNFLSVSGIGPKTALHLLSLGNVSEISSAINRGDNNYLTKVSGIGKKTAERLVVELRGKLSGDVNEISAEVVDNFADVVEGLVAMGYGLPQAREAVKKIDPKGKNTQQMMKEALRMVK